MSTTLPAECREIKWRATEQQLAVINLLNSNGSITSSDHQSKAIIRSSDNLPRVTTSPGLPYENIDCIICLHLSETVCDNRVINIKQYSENATMCVFSLFNVMFAGLSAHFSFVLCVCFTLWTEHSRSGFSRWPKYNEFGNFKTCGRYILVLLHRVQKRRLGSYYDTFCFLSDYLNLFNFDVAFFLVQLWI